MLFIINLAFILNGKHPVHSDLYHLISLSQLSFLPFGWDTIIRSKLSHVILCKEDCSCSSEKTLKFTMMRREKMEYLLDYQSRVLGDMMGSFVSFLLHDSYL